MKASTHEKVSIILTNPEQKEHKLFIIYEVVDGKDYLRLYFLDTATQEFKPLHPSEEMVIAILYSITNAIKLLKNYNYTEHGTSDELPIL